MTGDQIWLSGSELVPVYLLLSFNYVKPFLIHSNRFWISIQFQKTIWNTNRENFSLLYYRQYIFFFKPNPTGLKYVLRWFRSFFSKSSSVVTFELFIKTSPRNRSHTRKCFSMPIRSPYVLINKNRLVTLSLLTSFKCFLPKTQKSHSLDIFG